MINLSMTIQTNDDKILVFRFFTFFKPRLADCLLVVAAVSSGRAELSWHCGHSEIMKNYYNNKISNYAIHC